MRPPRFQFRLVVLMASVVFVALGLAALKQPYQPRISIALMLTVMLLIASALRSQFAPTRRSRAFWFGFSLFGWTHLLLVGSGWRDQLPTIVLVDGLVEWYTIHYGPYPTPMGRGPWYTNAVHDANGRFLIGALKLVEIYLTLVVAGAGAVLTGIIATWLRSDRQARMSKKS